MRGWHSLRHWRVLIGLAVLAGGLIGRRSPALGNEAPLKSGLTLQPRGVLVVNTTFSNATLQPGSYTYFAEPPAASESEFFISAAQSVLGFGITGLTLGPFAISGALDLSLRSPTPLQTANVLAPLFYNAQVQAKSERWTLMLGWLPDGVLAIRPDTLNVFPASYLAGSLGFARPQVQVRHRFPVQQEKAQFLLLLSANSPIQTFELTRELIGRQAGIPDGQVVIAFGAGTGEEPWDRPFEIGAAGHAGRRRVAGLTGETLGEFTTWSIGGYFQARLASDTTIKARVWRGALLGDYAAGVFQTVSPGVGRAVGASGGFLTVRQILSERWKASAGYGRDDPANTDLDPGGRTVNDVAFVNVSWDMTAVVGFGAEMARWRTGFRNGGATIAWTPNLLSFLRF